MVKDEWFEEANLRRREAVLRRVLAAGAEGDLLAAGGFFRHCDGRPPAARPAELAGLRYIPLMEEAAIHGRAGMVQALLDAGLDTRAVNGMCGPDGNSVLHVAAKVTEAVPVRAAPRFRWDGYEVEIGLRARVNGMWLVELYLHMTRGRDSSLPIAPCCHSLAMPVSIWDEGSLVIREFHKQLDVGRYRM
eukprot:1185901-Prorocentrum_minimum.AAC.1